MPDRDSFLSHPCSTLNVKLGEMTCTVCDALVRLAAVHAGKKHRNREKHTNGLPDKGMAGPDALKLKTMLQMLPNKVSK